VQLTVPAVEALALATAREPLPPFLRSLEVAGSTVLVEVDLAALPDAPPALRWVAVATGVVTVAARFTGYEHGVATFAVTSRARAMPLHVLLNALTGTVTSVLREKGLDQVLEVRRGEGEPVVAVAVQRAVDQRAEGIVVSALDLRDATVHATVEVGVVRLR
jgi:hypothetical protein